jgi:hypothetical protein
MTFDPLSIARRNASRDYPGQHLPTMVVRIVQLCPP